jgi:hypothetical protein
VCARVRVHVCVRIKELFPDVELVLGVCNNRGQTYLHSLIAGSHLIVVHWQWMKVTSQILRS